MNDQEIEKIQSILEKTGSGIAELISNLDIPMEYKEILIQKSIELVDEPKELAEFAQKLLEEYILQKAVEDDSEYKEGLKKIDQETKEEINNIIND